MRLQIEQLADDSMGQLIFVFGRQICQSAMLAPAPDQFIGIELGGIGRQVLRDNLRVFRQVRLYDFRLAVNVATIPQHGQRFAQLLLELPQERHNVLSVDIVIEKIEVQVQPAGFRTRGYTTDGGNPVSSIPAIEHGLTAPRRPSPSHRGSQHEAGFIEKNQVGVPLACPSQDSREMYLLPKLDPGLVALPRLPARFLGAPAQARSKKPPNMVVMKGHVEMPLDKLNDTSAGPQLCRPTMDFGSFQQESFQAAVLFGRQAWRRTRMGLGRQAVRLSSEVKPPVNGATIDAKHPRHCLGAFPLANGRDCLATPALQFRGGSKWSTHIN